jgi:hypothetical protein
MRAVAAAVDRSSNSDLIPVLRCGSLFRERSHFGTRPKIGITILSRTLGGSYPCRRGGGSSISELLPPRDNAGPAPSLPTLLLASDAYRMTYHSHPTAVPNWHATCSSSCVKQLGSGTGQLESQQEKVQLCGRETAARIRRFEHDFCLRVESATALFAERPGRCAGG